MADAFAHYKFIACNSPSEPLLRSAGILLLGDVGVVPLTKPKDCADFISRRRDLRFWDRNGA